MASKTYGKLCALSKACEILEPRWTLLVLSEMWNGYSRFNDIRRAVGNISPAILSKRLADLEEAGLVERVEDRAKGTVEYIRTAKAIDLEKAMNELAIWSQRNIDADVALVHQDLKQLMWALRPRIRRACFPTRRVVIRFHFTDEDGRYPTYWYVAEPGIEPEMCVSVPDIGVDLYIEAKKVSISAIFLGRSTAARETAEGRLFATGDERLRRSIDTWLPRSVYAEVDGIRQL